MICDKRILAVVPARGGSKGVPRKNLRQVQGVPIVARVGMVLAQLPQVDRMVVSTDDEEIAAVSESSGLSALWRRPPELSGDRISDLEVLTHALLATEEIDGLRYDWVLMLQPTSPMRRAEHVKKLLDEMSTGDWDAVWTVSETDSKAHPLKQLCVAPDGQLRYYDERGRDVIARQQLEPVYHRNGVAYCFTRDCLLEQRTILGSRTGAVVLDEPMVSIDNEFDLAFTEYLMSLDEQGKRYR